MAGRTSPVLRKRRLGRKLRQLREQAGMSLEAAAPLLDCKRSSLQRIEQGETRADVHFVRSAMDVYDHRDDSLIELAREAKEEGWWRRFGLKDRGFIVMETEAADVLSSQLVYVPGLLQTEDYVRAVFNSGKVRRSAQQLENGVKARLFRQERLTDGEAPLNLTAIIDEGALRRPVGGSEVQRAQLHHLIERAALNTVTLQVLPYNDKPHVGMDGSFTLLRFADPDDPDLLYVEYPTGAMHSEKPEETADAKLVFDQLRTEALPPDDSVAFIERLVDEL